ncbi:hypothetical protein B0S90_0964 [Caldicellulosiruptor bescii]|jgi:hypothetical protein|uniref:Uncharacterized protein n=2 Tax=Caldicellulosiruptor bescii TaxID=31899 RepID=B9MQ05_CALBD|nr:hypothetical protein [Caldicellulosiruptor bescii]ACM59797.1 hypothetical protein Athe_0678 [Caldicellulosiruptor bescii DSM 6725]PBC87208.1 hypothetical protein B0S87_0094 [Caldicellulosiruptor bescii]PBC90147.1 hypothetical protein B0S89_0467 [Caldicellulosiruptor bescii]PBD04423.1 hypothetical protein B0S85_2081 [Caldicellulosiruptor bescii]PBD05944.1 hypothetical protein B0S90_0964 [Caldicellulosiruptor bescii]
MNRKWFVVIFVILALDIVVSFIVKKSFINTETQSVSENIVDQCVFLNGGSFKGCNNENFSLEKIIRDSEVIVKGTALSDRIYLKGSVLTAFNVIKAYKGEITNSKIYIFEPSYFNLGKYNNYFAYCGYNLMKPGHNYILFLKKWKYTNFVRYNPYYRGKEIYVFAHNSAVDKFEINKSNTTKVINLEGNILIKYGQVKNYEVFVYNKNELTEYYQLKDKVLNWISQN